MTDRHLVVGAGPVGRHVAQLLADRGSDVVVATRSGTDTGIAGVGHLALDASDADALSAATEGASVLYNCANPGDYTSWTTVWPPLAEALLVAAERSGATCAITGNLYPYGPVDGPMSESTPDAATDRKGVLRARMWADARELHEAGRIRTVEVRGSDYVGTGVGGNGHVSRQVPGMLAGKRAWVLGAKDEPHAFTDVLDVARLLVAAAEDETALGRTWLVPSNPPRTQAEALTDVMAAVGRPAPKVSVVPGPVQAAAGLFVPLLRELNELAYQWNRPYLIDDSAARAHFGMEPTPWDEVCRRTAVV
ncbi:NAD-dependent epimerase/dehydratase family protein [Nocardioides marmoriginsengisoli]|uniref:NAD-dependent epimerase/dehydratase family protein n=1 Tax=Nocardioides marmoriginsengisoli TaxID=661483 RepID=A0A3N0CJV8_9ACTN|nr:NAD-dependent epimerase/dehydratase family protein [Nocardioides marmoriginsengisoli]RNL63223.1 NAD-dependent epimerase/dehydratase family protein [Nocardioides marmoriginsengisoli]